MKNLLVATLVLVLVGCSDNPSPESGAVVGGVTGAAVGGVVGHDLGHTGTGAVVGAATGAAVGAAVGMDGPDKQLVIDAQQDVISNQQEVIRRQGRDLDQIKRQQYWDERLKQHQ